MRIRHAGNMARRAFTLTEMLVVIGILLMLAALLTPVMTGILAKRDRLACASNLHQIGVATASYALDNLRCLPTHHGSPSISFDTFWMRREDGEYVNLGLLIGYVRAPEVFYCVSQNAHTSASIGYDTPENRWHSGSGGPGAQVPGAPDGLGGSDMPWVVAAVSVGAPWESQGVRGSSGPGGPGGPPDSSGPPAGVNSSFPARSREFLQATGGGPAALAAGAGPLPAWTMLNYTNQVIYSDFIGVDDWPGRGRFRGSLRAPHGSQGYNRLFGDAAVSWADAGRVNAARPVDATVPTAQDLEEYYKLLDVLP